MVALHSGVGQVVDVNLLESMLQLMGPLVSAYAVSGYEQPRLGAGIPYTVPRNTYRCADGRHVALGAIEPHFWARFCTAVGLPDLIAQQWPTGKDAEMQFATLRRLFAGKSRDQWLDHVKSLDVPLTEREQEIAKLVAAGQMSKEIAAQLNLSVRTVEKHRANIMEKGGVREVASLTRWCISVGLVDT